MSTNATLVCARCARPAQEQHKIGAYTYCTECVEKEPKWAKKVGEITDDGTHVWVNAGKP